jgi:DNA-binding transcriptional LysR family regulator
MLFPDVDVQVNYRRASQVYSDVIEGSADFGLVAFPIRRKGTTVESFWQDKLVLICAPVHPLAERRRVRFRDIANEKFISFEPDQPTTKAINRRLSEAGVTVRQAMEFDNVETVKRAVEIENGISVVPLATVSEEVASNHLVAVEFDEPDMFRPIGVIAKRNRAVSPAHRRFIDLLKNDTGGLGRFGDAPKAQEPSPSTGNSTKSGGARAAKKSGEGRVAGNRSAVVKSRSQKTAPRSPKA